MIPYYEDATCRIYHGDWRECPMTDLAVMVTDPPYGIAYNTGARRLGGNARSIRNDLDVTERDAALGAWGDKPALAFGSPKAPEPAGTRTRLVWDQGGALGMGDLRLPWKPSWQLIFVLGGPWAGKRDCGAVLHFPPVQSFRRLHPNQKPVSLLCDLLRKCVDGVVFDPFAGSGSTLVAARVMGRFAVGVELDEAYCEAAAARMLSSENVDHRHPKAA